MAWLREIGFEFVWIIVKSDNEPELTSLIVSSSTLKVMKSGSRMIVENSPVGCSKSNGVVGRATQARAHKIGMLMLRKLERFKEAVSNARPSLPPVTKGWMKSGRGVQKDASK